ncbi:MAG TPA: TolC family protein [Thermoanaerobaculia bacterium]|nr:TolC family protein [Thermoanaerobaculia bacterium]
MSRATALRAPALARLSSISTRTTPAIRAEASANRVETFSNLSPGAVRYDAMTAIVAVDYPLFERAASLRRSESAKTDALLYQQRAVDEADAVYRATVEAYAQLYLTTQHIELMADSIARARQLRERAKSLLEIGQISNLTAAQWQDQALAIEAQLLDLDLQRVEVETRLKLLIGDTTSEPLEVAIDFVSDSYRTPTEITKESLDRAALYEQRSRLTLDEVRAQRRPQVLVSAFAGVANDATDESFGIYGLRMSLTLPSLNSAIARSLSAAELELEEASRARAEAARQLRERETLRTLSLAAAEKRIEVLGRATFVAKQRQESIARLVAAGARTESDLLDAAAELAKRESDLAGARVERWKLQRLASRP